MENNILDSIKGNPQDAEAAKPKDNKRWKTIVVILAIVIVIVGALAVVMVIKGSNDAKKLRDAEARLERRDEEMKDLDRQLKAFTDKEMSKKYDSIRINIDVVKSVIANDLMVKNGKIKYQNFVIKTSENEKYILVSTTVEVEKLDQKIPYLLYKRNSTDGDWKILRNKGYGPCDKISDEKREIMQGLDYCLDNNGKITEVK